jgi:hypothetical protein
MFNTSGVNVIYLSLESMYFIAPCVYVMWANTLVEVMVVSPCSLNPFCDVMKRSGDIIVCVAYIVSCVGTNRCVS